MVQRRCETGRAKQCRDRVDNTNTYPARNGLSNIRGLRQFQKKRKTDPGRAMKLGAGLTRGADPDHQAEGNCVEKRRRAFEKTGMRREIIVSNRKWDKNLGQVNLRKATDCKRRK